MRVLFSKVYQAQNYTSLYEPFSLSYGLSHAALLAIAKGIIKEDQTRDRGRWSKLKCN